MDNKISPTNSFDHNKWNEAIAGKKEVRGYYQGLFSWVLCKLDIHQWVWLNHTYAGLKECWYCPRCERWKK